MFILYVFASLSSFFTKPVSVFPGPISTYSSICSSCISFIVLSNLTGEIIWFANISFMLSFLSYIFPSIFFITFTSPILSVTFSSSFSYAFFASISFIVWKGPLVFNFITFFAPASFNFMVASSIAEASPDIAVCIVQL